MENNEEFKTVEFQIDLNKLIILNYDTACNTLDQVCANISDEYTSDKVYTSKKYKY